MPNSATLTTYVYPTNKPKRDYQYEIVQACFTDNCLVALPTGLGKTFVAGVVMLNCTMLHLPGEADESLSVVSYRQDCLSSSDETACESTNRGLPNDLWNTK